MGSDAIILVGGGGHAKVIFDALSQLGTPVRGFVDDAPRCALLGQLEHLGAVAAVAQSELSSHPVILAVGQVSVRRDLLRLLGRVRLSGPVIHPGALVAPSAALGEGVFVGPGAIVNADARIENHAIINSGAIVEHDCRVGMNTHIAPGSVLGGGVEVGDDALVGLGARVLPGIAIGDRALVGAGAVVTRDVPSEAMVVGVPGRVSGEAVVRD